MSFVGRGMMRGGPLLAVGLCACGLLGSPREMEDGVFTTQGAASGLSLECSRRAVSGLGYTVNWSSGEETLRAERRGGEGANAWRGYLTVTVARENSGHLLLVSAERYAESSRLPIPANPAPRPTPQPTPPMPRAAPRRDSRRVGPGPVASDARNVVRRCSGHGEQSASVG